MSPDETAQRGKQLYEAKIRRLVETLETIGKIVAIDVDSGDYEVDSDVLAATRRLKARHESATVWAERIGYNAVFAVGGARTRTPEG
jgi:hypothetical protein